jgi:O-antigen ligase
MEANLQGNAIDRALQTLLIVLGLFILWKRKERFFDILRNNKNILLFFFYLGISALWADMTYVSLRKWFRLFGEMLMVIVILSESEPLEALKVTLRRCAYLLIPLSVVAVKYFPEFGVIYSSMGEKAWAGVALEKNGLGHLCMVSIFFFFWNIIASRGRMRSRREQIRLIIDTMVMMVGLWLLKGPGSYSATSVGALLFAVVFCLLLKFPIVKKNVGMFVILAVGIFMAINTSFNVVEILVSNMGRNMSFTERIPLWTVVTDIGLNRPILGYGYGGFWYGERILIIANRLRDFPEVGNVSFSQAHSGYIEIFLEGGFIGLLLLVVVVISSFVKIRKTLIVNYDYGSLAMSLLFMTLICNITESSFARPWGLLWFVFLMIAINIPQRDYLSNNVKMV